MGRNLCHYSSDVKNVTLEMRGDLSGGGGGGGGGAPWGQQAGGFPAPRAVVGLYTLNVVASELDSA
jgi:hypothetical protein